MTKAPQSESFRVDRHGDIAVITPSPEVESMSETVIQQAASMVIDTLKADLSRTEAGHDPPQDHEPQLEASRVVVASHGLYPSFLGLVLWPRLGPVLAPSGPSIH